MQEWIDRVEKHRSLIEDAHNWLWSHPETGFREWETHAYLKAAYEKLGYTLTMAGNIPGFCTELDTGRPGPTVLVMGEMDALICGNHPNANPQTGAVHCCGHSAQSAALLGLAAALKEPGALEGLNGKIRLAILPAEELIEVEYREQLRKEGIIHYFGGKVEFLYRGLLDGVDLAFMIHTTTGEPHTGVVNKGNNGCLTKQIHFQGVAAHAGGAPQYGVNALYAANLALNAINALRETFVDSAHVRVHPIMTAGGSAVNAIPELATIETYIRAVDMDTILTVNQKVNRAIAASAAAMGAKVFIQDRPGYYPNRNDENLAILFHEAMEQVLDHAYYRPDSQSTGSTDIGDLSCLMPVVHPYVSGATGTSHGADYQIPNVDSACMDSAKIQGIVLSLLLQDNAKRAREIIASFKPIFASKEEYFQQADAIARAWDAVIHNEDSSTTLIY